MKQEKKAVHEGAGMDKRAQVGERAPEFFIEGALGRLTLSRLAARVDKLILISQDSYQFHSN